MRAAIATIIATTENENNAVRIGLAILAVACAVCAVPAKGLGQTAAPSRQAPSTAPAPRVAPPAANQTKPATKSGASEAADAAAAKSTGPSLSLEDFLNQVREKNEAYVAALLGERGAHSRKDEYKLITRPTLIGSADNIDSRAESGSALQGDRLMQRNYQLGVRQVFDFGLQADLGYRYNATEIPGANPAFVQNEFVAAGPALSLSLPLLREGFGRGIRARKTAIGAEALAAAFRKDWDQTTILSAAEDAYWRLALAREALEASRQNLTRAERLRGWSSQRQRLQLADRSDFLQSDSSVLFYRLNLQTAINEEKIAVRAFNTTRGVDSDEASEQLISFEGNIIDRLQVPPRVALRSDVKEAEQNMRLAQARAIQGREANLPRFDLVGGVGYNGRDERSSEAVKESFGSDHPNYSIGVRVEIPLDLGTVNRDREGYRAEELAAAATYRRRVFEQDRAWNDLTNRFKESIERYHLAVDYERAQREKLDFERVRRNRGRTTTYQVTMFEQDFASAELARIRAKTDILTAYSQLKTFAGGNQ